jgi:hypothetical protein
MHLPLSEHLVAQPRPSRVMIKQNFLLWGILELKLSPRRRVYVDEIPKPSRVSLKLRQIPRQTLRILTTFYLHPRGFWYFNIDPPPRVSFLNDSWWQKAWYLTYSMLYLMVVQTLDWYFT